MPLTSTSPRLAYQVHGTEGPPVLLIMGLGMRGVVWRPQTETLRRDHRLVTFDNRGIGESEDAPGPWTVLDMADDALRVLDALGWASAHVVGVSMGGMIAQELALRAPGRVRSLTLIVTHAGGPTAWVPPLTGLARFLAVNLLPEKDRYGALADLLYPREFLREVDRDAMAARMADQVGGRATSGLRAKQLGAVMRHDTRARVSTIEASTLLVSAGVDVLVDPRRQRALARRIPHARHLRFERAGHGIIFQCASSLNPQLARHVATSESRA